MADEDLRRLEREAEHDDAARAALEVERERRGVPEEPPPPDSTPVTWSGDEDVRLSRPVEVERGSRTVAGWPRKNPIWSRALFKKGARHVDLLSGDAVFEESERGSGVLPYGASFFWYGATLYPTVTRENMDAVLQVWDDARYGFEFVPIRLLDHPAKLLMPNPVLLPHFGREMDVARLAIDLGEPKAAARIIRGSLFAQPIRDVTVMSRPIELRPQESFRATLDLREPLQDDVELLFVMFGVMLRGLHEVAIDRLQLVEDLASAD